MIRVRDGAQEKFVGKVLGRSRSKKVWKEQGGCLGVAGVQEQN